MARSFGWIKFGAGDFLNSQNWEETTNNNSSPAGPPGPADNFYILNRGTAEVAGSLYTENGAFFIVQNASTLAVTGRLSIASEGSATGTLVSRSTVTSEGLLLGDASGSNGTLSLSAAGTNGTSGTGAVTVGNAGTGLLSLSTSATYDASGSVVVLGSQQGSDGTVTLASGATFEALALRVGVLGSGSVSVAGTNSELSTDTLTVGGQKATATGDQSNPWSYSGGLGTLRILGSGQAQDNGSLSFLGGIISITSGGGIEVGGKNGVAADTFQIDSGATFKGHGSVDSTQTSSPVVGHTHTSVWSLSVVDNGTIEANSGLLTIHGNVDAANGKIKIDDNSSLEIGGSLKGTVDFQGAGQSSGNEQLIVDNPNALFDTQTNQGLATFSIENLAPGDSIVLNYTGFDNNNGVRAATIGTLKGQTTTVLDIKEADSPGATQSNNEVAITIGGLPTDVMSQNYFKVSQNGTSTVLTYTQGNPVAQAVDKPQGVSGLGIKVGIISRDLVASDEQTAINEGLLSSTIAQTNLGLGTGTDNEGLAMAEIVHEVAPGASLYFAPSGGSLGAMAAAVTALAQAGCNVIVDDIAFGVFNDAGQLIRGTEIHGSSSLETAIDTAVAKYHVTYISSAGNYRTIGIDVYGHQLDPNVATVAAMNLLATDTTVGGYILPPQTELSSSKGSIDITGPDGGPTSIGINPSGGSSLDPFFGTSAAAPTVAGVAALMMQSNLQLKGNAALVRQDLNASATPLPGNPPDSGHGLVDAAAAVALAGDPPTYFIQPTTHSTPVVASAYLSQPSGDADTGSLVELDVHLGDGVTVTGGTPTLSLSSGSTVASYDASVSDPANGELIFDYTVAAGDHTSNLKFTGYNANGATIEDASNTAASFSALFNVATGLTINSPLVVAGVTASKSGEAIAGQTVHLTVALNKALTLTVTGGNPTLSLNDYATATYDSGLSNLAGGKLVFDYKVATGDETANLAVSAIDLPTGTTITDASGNNADFAALSSFNTGLQVDSAFVSNYTTSLTTAAYSGQDLQLTLGLTGSVTVTGTPKLLLNDGASATYNSAASTPASGNLVFDYNVGASDRAANIYVTQVLLNGGTITDAFANAADLSGVVKIPTGVQVGPLAAQLSTSIAGNANTGQIVNLVVSFGGSLTFSAGNTAPTLTLSDNATATYDATLSDLANGGLVFDYMVGSKDQTPNLEATSFNPNGATIQDAQGVNVDFSMAFNASTGLTINSPLSPSSPSVQGSPPIDALTGQALQIAFNWSEFPVTIDTTNGTPTLTLNDGGTATYNLGNSQFNGTPTFDYTVGATDYTINRLAVTQLNLNGGTIRDSKGNNATLGSAAGPVTINPHDVNAAVVSGFSASASGIARPGQTLQLTVAMSEAVVLNAALGSPTLTLNSGPTLPSTATATYDANLSTPSTGKLVFDYTVGANDRSIDLHLSKINLNGATVTDTQGRPADTAINIFTNTGLAVAPSSTSAGYSTTPNNGEALPGQTVTFDLNSLWGFTIDTTHGTPTLSLNDNAVATYVSAPDQFNLIFKYIVGANDRTLNLQATQLNLNGSTLTDHYGVTMTLASSATGVQVGPDIVTGAATNPNVTHLELTTGQVVRLALAISGLPITIDTTNGQPTLVLNDGVTASFDSARSVGQLVFDYTVGSSDHTSALAVSSLNLNGAVIKDSAGTNVDFSAAAQSFQTPFYVPALHSGESFSIAVNTPVLSGTSTNSGTSTVSAGQTVHLILQMTDAVIVAGGTPTLVLNDGAVATYDATATANLSNADDLAFDYTVGAGDKTQSLQGSSVNFNGATIFDSASQSANFSNLSLFPFGVAVNAPSVTSVSPSQVSPLAAGQSATLTLTMNKAVTVTTTNGSPTLSLDDGGFATYDANASVPSTGKLVFEYTVAQSDFSPDLTVLGVNLNGAVVQGANGLNADFSNAVQELSVAVNAAMPSLTVAQALAEYGGNHGVTELAVADSSANVVGALDGLEAANAAITSITLTDPTTPNFNLSGIEYLADSQLIGKIGSAFNLQITLVAGADSIPAPTNSRVNGSGGHDVILGDGLHDQVAFAVSSTSFTLAKDNSGGVTLAGTSSQPIYQLDHVEFLKFSDQTIFIANPDSANIARLYSAALGRSPDTGGLSGWEDIYASNISSAAKAGGVYLSLAQSQDGFGSTIAGGFAQSVEFQAKYGNLDDGGFVTQLYLNVLDRSPAAAELNAWLGLMHDSGFTRDMVLVGFAESPENIAKTAGWLIQV